jgi:hypothetical protein
MLHQALRWLTSPQLTAAADGLPPRRPWLQVVQDFVQRFRQPPPASDRVATFLGEALREADLRLGLERAYRVLASLETDQAARYALVDQANAVRPQTVL